MAYIINDSRGQVVAVIPDGTIDTTSTSLQLVGRSVTDYGVAENENYVFLMENFANDVAPTRPLQGQLWFNTSTNLISVWNTESQWVPFATTDYVEAQKISPVFTGVPTAPTAGLLTSNTQIATTEFVQQQKFSPAFQGEPTAPTQPRGTNNTTLATTEFVANSVALLGVPTAPTAVAGTANTQIATTEFVSALFTNPIFNGVARAATAPRGTANTQIATTEFVTASPLFIGTPEAPTAPRGTANTQIATTQFVTDSPAFSGSPTAPNPAPGTANAQIATTAYVINSPNFQGTPRAPTTASNDNSTLIATTAFVQNQKANIVLTGIPRAPLPLGNVLDQIATVQYVATAVGGVDLTAYARLNSPEFVGIPRAPTAAVDTNSTQLATTAFVKSVVSSAIPGGGALWQGSAKFVSTTAPDPAQGQDGDFWFQYE